MELPSKLGPSTEIQELRDAFARAVDRVEESERECRVRSKASDASCAKSITA